MDILWVYMPNNESSSELRPWHSPRIHLLFSCRKRGFLESFSLYKGTDGCEIWGQRSLTLQQGCCCGYSLRDSIHTVDGLEELRDTIVLIRYQHLNLISASVMG